MSKRRVPFDNFALPIQGFNLKGEEKSKSWLGFIFTLAFLCAVLAVFVNELVSMFNRESLSVSISQESIPSPPPTNIKSLLLAFAVTNRISPLDSLEHDVDFNIKASTVTFQTVNNAETGRKELTLSEQPLNIQRCNQAYFGDLADEVDKKINIEDIYCIPRDQDDELFTIQGTIGDNISKEIYITIQCGPDGATSCPGAYWLSNIFFMYGSAFLNASNYENPTSLQATTFMNRADKNLYQERLMTITPREIITDTGVIFSKLESKTDLIISEGSNMVETMTFQEPVIFQFRIGMSTSRVVVKREYKMISDVLASTTGVASTIALVLGLIVKPYIEQKTHNDIMKIVSPTKYVPAQFKDRLKMLLGDKAAKQRIEKIEKEKQWIIENMDMTKMIKSWNELEKMKKSMYNVENIEVQDIEIQSFSKER